MEVRKLCSHFSQTHLARSELVTRAASELLEAFSPLTLRGRALILWQAVEENGLTLPQALVEVSRRAGLPVWIPPDAAGHCCGTPWSSKGLREGHARAAEALATSLWRWSDAGTLPVIIDAASCTHGVKVEVPDALDDAGRERLAQVDILALRG